MWAVKLFLVHPVVGVRNGLNNSKSNYVCVFIISDSHLESLFHSLNNDSGRYFRCTHLINLLNVCVCVFAGKFIRMALGDLIISATGVSRTSPKRY